MDGKLEHVDTVVLRPGDLFILGPKTNQELRHAVVPVSRERVIQRAADAPIEPRMSLVFRDICTTVSLQEAQKRGAKTIRDRQRRAEDKRVAQTEPEAPKPAKKRSKLA